MVPTQNIVAGPARLLHRLPDNIPFDVGAVIEPTAICVTSILERCQLQAGESVRHHRTRADWSHLPCHCKGIWGEEWWG